MRKNWRRQRNTQAPELNITAFMNLMVILVPFLLLTAVFSKITVLDLEIPASQESDSSQKPSELDLQVFVYASKLQFGNRQSGEFQTLETSDRESGIQALGSYLLDIKKRHPEKKDITLLLAADIPYSRVIAVMDSVRSSYSETTQTFTELFPAISIGDAPQQTETLP
ncbi:MAG: biopolymer transporter ExbD [Gammaproteobacteria bacterium]